MRKKEERKFHVSSALDSKQKIGIFQCLSDQIGKFHVQQICGLICFNLKEQTRQKHHNQSSFWRLVKLGLLCFSKGNLHMLTIIFYADYMQISFDFCPIFNTLLTKLL